MSVARETNHIRKWLNSCLVVRYTRRFKRTLYTVTSSL